MLAGGVIGHRAQVVEPPHAKSGPCHRSAGVLLDAHQKRTCAPAGTSRVCSAITIATSLSACLSAPPATRLSLAGADHRSARSTGCRSIPLGITPQQTRSCRAPAWPPFLARSPGRDSIHGVDERATVTSVTILQGDGSLAIEVATTRGMSSDLARGAGSPPLIPGTAHARPCAVPPS
jgi:hypothetical protein